MAVSPFSVINDAQLCSAIAGCRLRLLYVAPGISEATAEAIDQVLSRQDSPAVTVIIDPDPEVCRLGYGTVSGLARLQQVATEKCMAIRQQPGLRIGLLVCDDRMWIFAPTPLSIEASAERDDQPNALTLALPDAIAAVMLACAAEGGEQDSPLPADAEIGRQPATPEVIAASLQELVRQPPKPYDLARIERVYSSRLQYVEFEVSGYRLSSRRVQVPNDLLVGNDKTLEARLRNTFALLEGGEVLTVRIPDADPRTNEPLLDQSGQARLRDYSEKQIEEERKAIIKDFLVAITGYGQLISKARREDFDIRIEWFRDRIEAFRQAVMESLNDAVSKSVNDLVEALLPNVMRAPPARLLRGMLERNPGEAEIRAALRLELEAAFRLGDRFYQPSVKVVFKDLTYETIRDRRFLEQVEAAYRGFSATPLFVEYDAALEKHPRGR